MIVLLKSIFDKTTDNSVIGACSLVTSNIKCIENSILVGVPAKVVKTSINWDRKHI